MFFLKKFITPALFFMFMPGILFAGDVIMLENGVRITEKPRDFTKTAAVSILIDGGLFKETETNNGIGSLTGIVWVKSNKILETSEFYGAAIGAKLSPYAFEIMLSAPTAILHKILPDFSDFLLNPNFDEKIFNREKALYLEELKANMDNPNYIASVRFNEIAYMGMPYSMPVDGKIESVSNITLNDIKNYYKNNIKGSHMVVTIAGNYDKQFLDSIKKMLSGIDKGEPFKMNCNDAVIKKDIRVEETDKRIKQAKMFIGYTAPSASSPDYPALKVLNELLGGGMSSRYFREIRAALGYSYSVYSAYPSRACSSRFFAAAGLDYENADDAIKKFDEIHKNLPETMTDEEINKAKKSLLGTALMTTQTNSSIAWNASFFELLGLGSDYYEKYVQTLENIGKKDLVRVSQIFSKPKAIYILKPEEEKK